MAVENKDEYKKSSNSYEQFQQFNEILDESKKQNMKAEKQDKKVEKDLSSSDTLEVGGGTRGLIAEMNQVLQASPTPQESVDRVNKSLNNIINNKNITLNELV